MDKHIKKATLYIESYDKDENSMLLEFVREDEFFFFMNRGDYNPNMRFNGDGYIPTMIMVYGIDSEKEIKEKSILEIDMRFLIHFSFSNNNLDTERMEQESALVFGVIRNGRGFSEIIDNPNLCFARNSKRSDFIPSSFFNDTFGGSHYDNPMNNSNLFNDLGNGLGGSSESCKSIDVWNVGSGNSNRLVNDKGIILYDLGSYRYNSSAKIKVIFNRLSPYMGNNPAIIISHWDVDHYNQLVVVTKPFLQTVRCIVFPAWAIGNSAKQILLKISVCQKCISIAPPNTVSAHCIVPIYDLGYMRLYIGGKSKYKNQSGLLIRAKGDNSFGYLTGDNTRWSQLLSEPDTIDRKLIHVVVPHHGGKANKLNSLNTSNKAGDAVISVGVNTNGHPCSKTIKNYIREGFSVKRTDIIGDYKVSL